jgi:hypothetical protein
MTPLLAAILTGLVVDITGAPIPNTKVEYRKDESVPTDNNGRFTTPDLPPGIYHLRIEQPGFVVRRKGPIDLKQSLDLGTLYLRIGEIPCCDCEERPPTITRKPAPSHSSLRGSIANHPDDSPAEVLLLPGPHRQPIAADGTFEFPNLPPGRYSLQTDAPPHGPFEIPRLQIRPRTAHTIEEWITLRPTPTRTVWRIRKTRHPSFCL